MLTIVYFHPLACRFIVALVCITTLPFVRLEMKSMRFDRSLDYQLPNKHFSYEELAAIPDFDQPATSFVTTRWNVSYSIPEVRELLALPFLTFMDRDPTLPYPIDDDARAPMHLTKFNAKGDVVSSCFAGYNAFPSYGSSSDAGLIDSQFASRPYFQVLPVVYDDLEGYLMQVVSGDDDSRGLPTFGDSSGPFIFASSDRKFSDRFETPFIQESQSTRLDGHEFHLSSNNDLWTLYHDERLLDLRSGIDANGDLMRRVLNGMSCGSDGYCVFPDNVEDPFLLSDFVALCKRHPFLKVEFPGIMSVRPRSRGGGIVRRTHMYERPASAFALGRMTHLRADPRCNPVTGFRYDRSSGGCLMRFEGIAEMGFGAGTVGPAFNVQVSKYLGLGRSSFANPDLLRGLSEFPGGYRNLTSLTNGDLTCQVIYRAGCKKSLDAFHFNSFSFSADEKLLVLSSYLQHDVWFVDFKTFQPLAAMKSSPDLWERGSYNLWSTAIDVSGKFDNNGAAFFQHAVRFVTVRPGGGYYITGNSYHLLAFCNGLNRYSWQTNEQSHEMTKYSEKAFNPIVFERTGELVPGQSSRCVEMEIVLPQFTKAKLVKKGSAKLVWTATFEEVYAFSSHSKRVQDGGNRTIAPMVTQIEGACQRFADGSTGISWGVNAPQRAGSNSASINAQPFFTVVQTRWKDRLYSNFAMFDIKVHGEHKVSFAYLPTSKHRVRK